MPARPKYNVNWNIMWDMRLPQLVRVPSHTTHQFFRLEWATVPPIFPGQTQRVAIIGKHGNFSGGDEKHETTLCLLWSMWTTRMAYHFNLFYHLSLCNFSCLISSSRAGKEKKEWCICTQLGTNRVVCVDCEVMMAKEVLFYDFMACYSILCTVHLENVSSHHSQFRIYNLQ